MKKITIFISLFIFAFISVLPAAGQDSGFQGAWKLDRTKSTVLEYFPTLVRLDVQIKGDSLLTERTYDTGDGQEYPFTENLTLDGKQYNITIYEMPRKSKASRGEQGSILSLESTTTSNGSNGPEDFVSKETGELINNPNTYDQFQKFKLCRGIRGFLTLQ
jgi:hypothetical protein